MTIAIRKLAIIGSSARVFNHLARKPRIEEILARSCLHVNYRHLSEHSFDQTGSRVSTIYAEDCVHMEFEKWRNGGGFFHKSAQIDPTALIEIGAVVHSKSVLGANVHIQSGTIVGPAVTIGQSTKIGYNTALSNCSIGDSCIIHNGACIGQDGFGFFVDEQGNMLKKPQVLYARIGNHVEIGANTCIDRGSWRETVIGDHTKIDNLVQIGHNAVIGKCCMLCGQVGIAGSVTMGDYVTLGGKVAVRDHVYIAPKVRLAANSCVTKDIREPGDYGGFPAVPIHEWRRQVATQRWNCKKGIS
ncbi:Bacterial transferase hexapeptide repeat [Macleaya cordata]|uniref:Bacterial transferase hexapeptide repeat n=1 Tax=Macleaya cordata TaxID=56857 RepID=A0A200QL62_MACCD|nr:Bacterial transferase hexapeptide repeat [Macleaya cordata]